MISFGGGPGKRVSLDTRFRLQNFYHNFGPKETCELLVILV